MIDTTFGTQRADDLALAARDQIEELAIAAALKLSQTVTAYAIVAMIKGELVSLVTRCKIGERATWRELLGLHMSHGAVEDLDANWGMAWIDPDGSVHMAGPNLMFAKRAQDKVTTYTFADGDTSLPMERTNTKHDTPFAFIGENEVEGPVYVDVEVLPDERQHIGELFGINPTDTWGMAWQPYTAHTSADGTAEFEVHDVIVATGTSVVQAYAAFAELAICHAGQH